MANDLVLDATVLQDLAYRKCRVSFTATLIRWIAYVTELRNSRFFAQRDDLFQLPFTYAGGTSILPELRISAG
jgi:hypothetical protein